MEKQKLSFKRVSEKKLFRLPHLGESPESDWKIIFVFASILLAVSIAISAFIFIQIGNGEMFGVDQTGESEDTSLSIERLEVTVPYYQEKSAEFGRLRSGVAPAADPSL